MDILQESSLKHARKTNETLAKEVGRFEKVTSSLEIFTKTQLSALQKESTQRDAETEKWKVNFEDVQARKIVEIH